MDYPKELSKNHVRFHKMVDATPFAKHWSIEPGREYLRMNFDTFRASYGPLSDGEKAFARFLMAVWDKNHNGSDIDQFWLRDMQELDGRYALTVAQWASNPFWA